MVAPLADFLVLLPHCLGRLRVRGEFLRLPRLVLALLLQELCLRLADLVLVFLLTALRNRRLGQQARPRDNMFPTVVYTEPLLLAGPLEALAQFLHVGQALSALAVP